MQDHLPSRSRRQRVNRRLRYLYLSAAQWRRQVPVWIAAILIGLVAYVFARGSHWSHDLFFKAYGASPYWSLLITPAGLALAIWIMHRFFPSSAGGGIPQSIAALEPGMHKLREYCFTLKAAFGKVLLTLIGISSGATFGYEGPIVQVGAAIKYSLNRKAAQRHDGAARSFILAGGAAGVAAAFNAPLAGVMFAIEELARTLEQRSSGLIIAAIVLSGLMGVSFFGNATYFGTIAVPPLHPRMLWPALLLVLACGALGGVFARLLHASLTGTGDRFGRWRAAHPVAFAAACGLAAGAVGVASHGAAFGSGYGYTRSLLQGAPDVPLLFVTLRVVATWLAVWSGVPGGIFAPCLAIGAGVGHDIAALTGTQADAAVLIAIGMAAFLAAVTQAPMTSFIIVMEMVGGHAMVLSLMAAALGASLVSRWLARPLYTALAQAIVARAAAPAPR